MFLSYSQDLGEELDPALRPVLLQETIRKGGQLVMKIGDVEIEYNQNFRYASQSVCLNVMDILFINL